MSEQQQQPLASADKEQIDCLLKIASDVIQVDAFVTMFTENSLTSIECALGLGMAILHGKPVYLLVDKNAICPTGLVKLAKLIERIDINNEQDMHRAVASIKQQVEQEIQAKKVEQE